MAGKLETHLTKKLKPRRSLNLSNTLKTYQKIFFYIDNKKCIKETTF